MDILKARDDIASWLRRAGFQVSEKTPPPGTKWVLEASMGGVKLQVAGLEHAQAVVFSIGIVFSREHLEALNKLQPEERVKLSAWILRAVANVCPSCRVVIQPSLSEPRAIVAQRILLLEGVEPRTVVDYASTMLAVFLVVNTVLWEQFPALKPPPAGQGQTYIR